MPQLNISLLLIDNGVPALLGKHPRSEQSENAISFMKSPKFGKQNMVAHQEPLCSNSKTNLLVGANYTKANVIGGANYVNVDKRTSTNFII